MLFLKAELPPLAQRVFFLSISPREWTNNPLLHSPIPLPLRIIFPSSRLLSKHPTAKTNGSLKSSSSGLRKSFSGNESLFRRKTTSPSALDTPLLTAEEKPIFFLFFKTLTG